MVNNDRFVTRPAESSAYGQVRTPIAQEQVTKSHRRCTRHWTELSAGLYTLDSALHFAQERATQILFRRTHRHFEQAPSVFILTVGGQIAAVQLLRIEKPDGQPRKTRVANI